MYVLVRLYAVPQYYYIDFLSVHVHRFQIFSPHASLLDQHGGRRHYDTGGFDADDERAELAIPDRDLTFFERFYVILLDYRHLVDSAIVHSDDLAASLSPLSARVRAAILGNGVSASHVYDEHVSII